jgi:hypothetical protein
MYRSLIPFTLILFAAAAFAVPAALAKGGHGGALSVRGTCTQQSTSKLKLSRDDRGIEVEFQVDQNRNGVPWKVTLGRSGTRVASLTARTHAPSGSFEIRRLIANGPGADRITARATRASGEVCSASAAAPKAAGHNSTRSSTGDDTPAHDRGDDHGHDA